MLPERRALMAECGVEAAGDAGSRAGRTPTWRFRWSPPMPPFDAAQDYAALLPEGALWCDMNSVAPRDQAFRGRSDRGARADAMSTSP